MRSLYPLTASLVLLALIACARDEGKGGPAKKAAESAPAPAKAEPVAQKPPEPKEEKPAGTPHVAKPEVFARAGFPALWNEFRKNLVAAEEKYKDKYLAITVMIDRMGKDEESGRYYFTAAIVGDRPDLYAPGMVGTFAKEALAEAAKIETRKGTVIIGKFSGTKQHPKAFEGLVLQFSDCRPEKK